MQVENLTCEESVYVMALLGPFVRLVGGAENFNAVWEMFHAICLHNRIVRRYRC